MDRLEEGSAAYYIDNGRRCGLVVIVDNENGDSFRPYTVGAHTPIMRWNGNSCYKAQDLGAILKVKPEELRPIVR